MDSCCRVSRGSISLAMSQYRREQKDPSRDEAEASTPPIDRKGPSRTKAGNGVDFGMCGKSGRQQIWIFTAVWSKVWSEMVLDRVLGAVVLLLVATSVAWYLHWIPQLPFSKKHSAKTAASTMTRPAPIVNSAPQKLADAPTDSTKPMETLGATVYGCNNVKFLDIELWVSVDGGE